MSQYRRMTTEPVGRLVAELGVPSMLSMVISTVYNMVDTWFVARLGTQATAAVGISFAIMELINSLGYLFGTGAARGSGFCWAQGKSGAPPRPAPPRPLRRWRCRCAFPSRG